MNSVFVLQHEYEWCGRDEVKLLGVYASQAAADAAVARLKTQPGFRDWPAGFSVDEYQIGVDHWCEGFAIMVPILLPSRTKCDEFHAALAAWSPGELYRITILDQADDSTFAVGDVVRCVEQPIAGHGNAALVAVELTTTED